MNEWTCVWEHVVGDDGGGYCENKNMYKFEI